MVETWPMQSNFCTIHDAMSTWQFLLSGKNVLRKVSTYLAVQVGLPVFIAKPASLHLVK